MKHAKDRTEERYRISLNDADMGRLITEIRCGRAVYLGDAKRGCELWAVRHRMHWLPVVYRPSTGYILTVLPLKRLLPYLHMIPVGR